MINPICAQWTLPTLPCSQLASEAICFLVFMNTGNISSCLINSLTKLLISRLVRHSRQLMLKKRLEGFTSFSFSSKTTDNHKLKILLLLMGPPIREISTQGCFYRNLTQFVFSRLTCHERFSADDLELLIQEIDLQNRGSNEDGGNRSVFINIDKRTKYPKLTINLS